MIGKKIPGLEARVGCTLLYFTPRGSVLLLCVYSGFSRSVLQSVFLLVSGEDSTWSVSGHCIIVEVSCSALDQ